VTLRPFLAIVLAAALAVTVGGCAGDTTGLTETVGLTSVSTTDAPPAGLTTDDVDAVPQATSPQVKALDPGGVGTELDAMEKELDQMDMPSDADFSDAEGALY
jgi:hypothetical protein